MKSGRLRLAGARGGLADRQRVLEVGVGTRDHVNGHEFAHAAGLRTIVTSSSDAKLERARLLGADPLINYRATPEWSRPVREATGGVGADFIMEVGGAELTVYDNHDLRSGERTWFDLCRGPHMTSTGKIGDAFKLMKVAGAYWRGDSTRPMLTRMPNCLR